MPPAAFERLTRRLLREPDFRAVEVLGKSGDGAPPVELVDGDDLCDPEWREPLPCPPPSSVLFLGWALIESLSMGIKFNDIVKAAKKARLWLTLVCLLVLAVCGVLVWVFEVRGSIMGVPIMLAIAVLLMMWGRRRRRALIEL